MTADRITAIGTERRPTGPRAMGRRAVGRVALAVLVLALAGLPARVSAEGVEVLALQIERDAAAVTIDFALRVTLPVPVEDALRRGVPLHFRAEAALYRPRWYWRDERVGRTSRQWRLSYQPLTSSYRVSIGGLHQTFGSLDEAMASITRLSQWRVADAADVDTDEEHYLEFSWRLDTSQLPRPMQIGIGNLPEWTLEVERTLPIEPR